MRQLLIPYIFLTFFVPLFGQIEENFIDGNLTDNPTWEGDTADFIINANAQLQLNAAMAGQSSIYLSTFIEKEMEWLFFFNMDFNPSASNAIRVYLQADNTNLLESSGYFIEVGETGDEDAIKFYRQDVGNKVLLAMGTLGAVANSPNVRVQVKREKEGTWSIFADYSGGSDFVLETTVTDETYNQNGFYFFGLLAKYTASRTTAFFYDDIFITPLQEDVSPPTLIALKTLDKQTLELTFDEPLSEETSIQTEHYFIDKGIGNPSKVELSTPNKVSLMLNNEFQNNTTYTIQLNNITDLKGNILTNFDTTFLFTQIEVAEPFDIIINEIMEDATLNGGGTLGLPAEEYVELYNRSNKTINLEDFVFTDGGARQPVFPFYLMPSNSYLIIGKPTAESLGDFGNFLGLTNFPTLSAAEELVLKNEFGDLIDVVSYTQEWYGSTRNAAGSIALERINPQNPCAGQVNWTGSSSFLGGTPGGENATLDLTIANDAVNLIDAYPIDATHIRLTFDQAANNNSFLENNNYIVSNNTVINAVLLENNLTQVIIELARPLMENTIISIGVDRPFTDCLNRPLTGRRSIPVALPTLASANDLVINEILFNPQTGGVDFVELLNRSQNVIDLSTLFIINQAVDEPDPKPVFIEKLIFPNDYVVFTKSPTDILTRYRVETPTALIQQDLPTFADKEGNVSIYINDGLSTIFIDQFDYTADLHNPLLNDKNGVSLERVNPDLPTQSAGNWQSASAIVDFATPTYRNSQTLATNASSNTIFSLSSNRLSPDGDGFEDFLQINYKTDASGYSATIHIYDATGRLIRKVAQNQLLSTTGSFKWEGITVDEQKARTGIYVLWIEYVNLNGEVGQMKEAIVVAERF